MTGGTLLTVHPDHQVTEELISFKRRGIPMKAARVFEKELMIPTYDVGKEKKIPCFLKNGFTRAAPAGCIPIP